MRNNYVAFGFLYFTPFLKTVQLVSKLNMIKLALG